MQEYTAAELKKIGDYILVETPLAHADVCILFGNAHADHLAAGAAEVYAAGYFNLVISTGGVATDDGRLESDRMRDVMVEKGVPESSIIVERKAQSTVENVIYCMDMLDKKVGLDNVRSVLAIGHIHASRRFLMTLERHWPEVTKMFTTSNCYSVSRENWHADPKFRKDVLFEYENAVPSQLAKDYIREIDLGKFKS